MNKTKIKVKDQEVDIVFGTWVMGQLIKSGYALGELQAEIQKNPFEFFPNLIYLGAINATSNKDLAAYNKADFYDVVDELGGIASPAVMDIIHCFTNSLGMDVSKKKETTPPKLKK